MRPDYKRAVVIVYVLGVFIQILDATVVNVALPAIGRDFGIPANEVEWVVLGYLLTLTIGIPAAPWLADRFGSKRAFILSLIGFVGTSVLCAMAPSLEWLVAARVLQGLPAGLITPVGAAILYRAFPQNERARAAAAVVGVAVVAPSIGPVLGGLLVDNASWPWIFYINLPIGALAIALAWAWLREEAPSRSARFDAQGFVLAAVGLASVLFALSSGPRAGWGSATVLVFLALGVGCLGALVRVELSVEDPMVDLRLLADRHFRTVNLIGLSVYSAFLALIYLLPIYLQSYRGLSATASGTAQVPQAIGVFLVSNLAARRAYQRFGPRMTLTAGSVVAAVASALFIAIGDDTSLWLIRGGMAIRGFGMGFVFVTIQTIAYATTSLADTARAVSIYSTQRQLASALGVAAVATALTSLVRIDIGLTAYRVTFGLAAAMFIPGIIWALTIRDDDVANTRSG